MIEYEFFAKWDEKAIYSQDACNPSGLLHSAGEMISDWRSTGGNSQGKDCPHLKFLLYQTVFLVFGREMDWNEWHDEYRRIQKRTIELKGGSGFGQK